MPSATQTWIKACEKHICIYHSNFSWLIYWVYICFIKLGDCSIRAFQFRISNNCWKISPKRISEDFGYVVLHKILYTIVPNISWYHFFTQNCSTARLIVKPKKCFFINRKPFQWVATNVLLNRIYWLTYRCKRQM